MTLLQRCCFFSSSRAAVFPTEAVYLSRNLSLVLSSNNNKLDSHHRRHHHHPTKSWSSLRTAAATKNIAQTNIQSQYERAIRIVNVNSSIQTKYWTHQSLYGWSILTFSKHEQCALALCKWYKIYCFHSFCLIANDKSWAETFVSWEWQSLFLFDCFSYH